jgi:hypothetical protein
LILVGVLFLLDGGRRREGKLKRKEERKKICHGEGGFPLGWICLAGRATGHSC